MKKIISIIVLCFMAASYAAAQATLPFAEFTKESFDNTSYFTSKKSASWSTADGGRIDVAKTGNFVIHFTGTPGVLTLHAKRNGNLLSNARLTVEGSSNGSNWTTLLSSAELKETEEIFLIDLPLDATYVRISNPSNPFVGTATLFINELSISDYEFTASAESLSFPDTQAIGEMSELSLSVKGKGIASDATVSFKNGTLFSADVTTLPAAQMTAEAGEGATVKITFAPLEMGTFADTLLVTVGTKDTLSIPLQGVSTTIQKFEMYATAEKLTFPDIKAITETHTLQVAIKGGGLLSNPLVKLLNGTVFTTLVTELSHEEVNDTDGEGAKIDITFSPMEIGSFADTLLVVYDSKDTVRVALEAVSTSYQAELITSAEFTPFASSYLTPAQGQPMQLNVEYLTSDVMLKAPTHFKVSTDGIAYADSISVPFADLNAAIETVVFVRMETRFVGKFSGKVTAYNKESRVPLHEYPVLGEVVKAVPSVSELPIPARELVSGETLGGLALTGGAVLNAAGDTISGEFRWVDAADFVPEIGITELPIYFVPAYSYGYETANATASVTVLRATQSLTWEQEFDVVQVGEAISFVAEATSGLPVTYSASKPELLRIEGGEATALAPGRVRVIATQEGNAKFQPTEGIAYYITIATPLNVEVSSSATTKVFCAGGALRMESDEAFTLQLFDTMGRVVMSDAVESASKSVPIGTLAQRMLIARLRYSDGSTQSIKVPLTR